MKVRVIRKAYLANAVRTPGTVFDWENAPAKLPPCVESIEETGTSKESSTTAKKVKQVG